MLRPPCWRLKGRAVSSPKGEFLSTPFWVFLPSGVRAQLTHKLWPILHPEHILVGKALDHRHTQAPPEKTAHNWPYTSQSGTTICPQKHILKYIVPAKTYTQPERTPNLSPQARIMTAPQSQSHSVTNRCKKAPDTHPNTEAWGAPTRTAQSPPSVFWTVTQPRSNRSRLFAPLRQVLTWRAGTHLPPVLKYKLDILKKHDPPSPDTQGAPCVCASRHTSRHKDRCCTDIDSPSMTPSPRSTEV